MSIDLTDTQRAELDQGHPVLVENGQYIIISRKIYDLVRESLDVPESDWSLYEIVDPADEP